MRRIGASICLEIQKKEMVCHFNRHFAWDEIILEMRQTKPI